MNYAAIIQMAEALASTVKETEIVLKNIPVQSIPEEYKTLEREEHTVIREWAFRVENNVYSSWVVIHTLPF